jgi:hypothetical protein
MAQQWAFALDAFDVICNIFPFTLIVVDIYFED